MVVGGIRLLLRLGTEERSVRGDSKDERRDHFGGRGGIAVVVRGKVWRRRRRRINEVKEGINIVEVVAGW